MTDPNSVVRESEYARTPENLPVVNRITGAIEKAIHGGAGMTDEDRKALVIGAKVIANERGKVFADRRGKYSKLAERAGIPPENVTGMIDEFSPFSLEAGPATTRQGIALQGADATRLATLRAKKANGTLSGGK